MDPSAVLSTNLPLSNAAKSLLKTFYVWRIRLGKPTPKSPARAPSELSSRSQ